MRPSANRLSMILLIALAALASGACTAPQPASAQAPALASRSDVVPMPFASELAAHDGVRLDCRTDTDCEVRDIGNCCGSYPTCVNTTSTVDPAAVARECTDKGMASVCGYPEIRGCICDAGTCAAAPTDADGLLLR